VQQLAGMLDISRRQLYRDIHTLLNKPVGKWIRELRLYKAKWLIQKKQVITLEELVQQVGFKSTDHFRRIYRDFFHTDLSVHLPHSATYLAHKLDERQIR
jgi:transcriptional regulator GlxA family with amidase domain